MAIHNVDRSTADSATETSLSLIRQVKDNDPLAWERLVRLYSPLVYYWCKRPGVSEPDVHDIFQNVFYSLARNIHKFRSLENGTFRGWLRTMTRNKLHDHFRTAGRQPRPMGGTDALKLFDQLPFAEEANASSALHPAVQDSELALQHELLRQALANIRDSFAEQTWQAFWMVVVEGSEVNDVAGELQMRPGTVRVAKSRILKRLRSELGDDT